MGNLRSKYTDEEWKQLQEAIENRNNKPIIRSSMVAPSMQYNHNKKNNMENQSDKIPGLNKEKGMQTFKADIILNEIKSLRTMQKQFFKTRDYAILNKCKMQESKVDNMIKEYFDNQGKLF